MGPAESAKLVRASTADAGCHRERATIESSAARSLHVCHLVGSLQYGGAERQVVNLLNQLGSAKTFALLLGRPTPGGLSDLLDPRVSRDFVDLRLRRLPLDIVRVANVLRRWRIDVLHTHMFWANLAGAIAGRLAGVTVVVTSEHGKNLWKGPAHRWAERWLISPLVDLRVCASEDIRRLRHEDDGIPADKLTHIPNGTCLPDLKGRSERRAPLVGTVGRFVEAKDYRTLIEAAAALRAKGVDFRLCLVGDGPERANIEHAIATHGLTSVVELTGYQADVPAWLATFSVFVMSSIREGQPLALLEAMAHGLPIVATRVGGIPATVADGVEAILVDPHSPELLAEALRQLLRDPQQRVCLGAAARERAEREFSIKAVAARYAQVYQDLWDRKHEARA